MRANLRVFLLHYTRYVVVVVLVKLHLTEHFFGEYHTRKSQSKSLEQIGESCAYKYTNLPCFPCCVFGIKIRIENNNAATLLNIFPKLQFPRRFLHSHHAHKNLQVRAFSSPLLCGTATSTRKPENMPFLFFDSFFFKFVFSFQ